MGLRTLVVFSLFLQSQLGFSATKSVGEINQELCSYSVKIGYFNDLDECLESSEFIPETDVTFDGVEHTLSFTSCKSGDGLNKGAIEVIWTNQNKIMEGYYPSDQCRK